MSIKQKTVCSILIFCTIITVSARDITTNNGKTYKDVDVEAKVNGLTIFHSYGASFENFDNLSKAIQEEFHYDKAKADRYKEKLRLKNQKKADKLAKRQALIKQRQAAKKKQQAILAQQYKAKVKVIKPRIIQKGIPVLLTRQVLYNLDGKPLFASTKLVGQAKFFLAHEDYMLVDGKVYLAKDNVTSAGEKLENMEDEIKDFTKTIATKETEIKKLQKSIDSNDDRIKKAQQVIDSFNEDNKHYDELSKTQKRLIKQYAKDNNKLDRDMSKAHRKIKSCTKKLKQSKIKFSSLSDALNEFKAIYDKKSAEIINEQLK
jgi:DNA repair exonuclease SbcCD ATPase subunit